MEDEPEKLLLQLEKYLEKLTSGGVALAYSGGVDSSLLLAVLSRLHQRTSFPFLALTFTSELHTAEDVENARHNACGMAAEHRIVRCRLLDLPEVRNNTPERCYHCKHHIFSQFREIASAAGITHLADGTLADDMQRYRPGVRAARELGVISPLAELGIDKAAVRQMAAFLGLSSSSRPAAPCFATRFDYNTVLSEEKIKQIMEAEKYCRCYLPPAANLRVRVHGDLLRIETDPEYAGTFLAHKQELSEHLRQGWVKYVTLDLNGFNSGSFDRKER